MAMRSAASVSRAPKAGQWPMRLALRPAWTPSPMSFSKTTRISEVSMFRISHLFMVASAAALLMAPQAYAQTKLTSEMAMAAARAVQTYAKNDGSDPSTVVLDTNGDIVLQLKGNNAAPHNIGLAERKAYTANMFKMK